MKIALYSRPEIVHHPEELCGLLEVLDEHAIVYSVNTGFAEVITEQTGKEMTEDQIYHEAPPEETEMVISFGGDGTFLDTVRLLDTRPVPVLGINYGRLGFLANISKEHMADAIRDIAAGKYEVEERILLHAEGDFGQQVGYPYAFNEFSLQKNSTAMVYVEVNINGEQVTTYQGDGLILSTPAGSTAYSLSVGGPILSPNCNAFILAPIASHNLTMRPLVIPDESVMCFRVESRTGDAVATLDSREYVIPSGSCFTLKKSKKSAFLVKLQNISFYQTLRDKMMWGMDSREFTK